MNSLSRYRFSTPEEFRRPSDFRQGGPGVIALGSQNIERLQDLGLLRLRAYPSAELSAGNLRRRQSDWATSIDSLHGIAFRRLFNKPANPSCSQFWLLGPNQLDMSSPVRD